MKIFENRIDQFAGAGFHAEISAPGVRRESAQNQRASRGMRLGAGIKGVDRNFVLQRRNDGVRISLKTDRVIAIRKQNQNLLAAAFAMIAF